MKTLKNKIINRKLKKTIKNKKRKKEKDKFYKLKKLNCSPKPKGEINNFTCYSNKSLFRLRELWNSRHPDYKIISNSPKEIHRIISEKLAWLLL